jgi:hypothetical protein
VRDDHAAGLAQRLVAADVVAVVVRVDDEPHRPLVDLADRRQQLVGQRLQLIVDDEHAVLPGRHGDVAAPALDHGDGVGQPGRDILDFLILREHAGCRCAKQENGAEKQAAKYGTTVE